MLKLNITEIDFEIEIGYKSISDHLFFRKCLVLICQLSLMTKLNWW